MFKRNTDRQWEIFGKIDPYFSVLTQDKYRKSNLTEENREDFFTSGHDYIDNVLNIVRKHIDTTYSPKKAIDFGCGVGRLVIPLARIAEKVVGMDVSESMLDEARANCKTRSLKNVEFLKSDDRLSLLKGKYDFIHSFIVFQHIPVKRGEHIFENIFEHLEDEGICVLHFTYAESHQIKNFMRILIIKYIPLARKIINLVKGRGFFYPVIQMNTYNLNKLFFLLQGKNVRNIYAEYTDHGGYLGIILFFKKQREV